MTTIALNMIIRNEAHVIERCLTSVLNVIDSWCIVDTGSTDGTQEIIKSFFAKHEIPGELHERPWKDFGHNRSEAIALAERYGSHGPDYLLVIDADDLLIVPPNWRMPRLEKDAYFLHFDDAGTSYKRLQVFKTNRGFHYEGVLHEVLMPVDGRTQGVIEGLIYKRTGGGARSKDPQKYRKDAEILQAALENDPTNARYAFYLAQSWRDAGENEKCWAAYERRAEMDGWDEEVYVSLYEAAKARERLEQPEERVIDAFLRAYDARPTRAEPLTYLAAYLRFRGRQRAAYPFAKQAAWTMRPADILFVDDSVYAWRALDEYAVASFWMGDYAECDHACKLLLGGGKLPEGERERVKGNLALARERMGTSRAAPAPHAAPTNLNRHQRRAALKAR
jgi:glycosyltransferase involved in cell wall biosynthesis